MLFGYVRTGSYSKKIKQYKLEWNWLERALLVPLFRSTNRGKYRALATINYVHFGLAVLTVIGHVISEFGGAHEIIWQRGIAYLAVICIIQTIMICTST